MVGVLGKWAACWTLCSNINDVDVPFFSIKCSYSVERCGRNGEAKLLIVLLLVVVLMVEGAVKFNGSSAASMEGDLDVP